MPATFGQMLTAAREKRGLSIDDAAHETRIPAQRLRLLESDNIAGFGSMTYARAFIRDYSEFLELSADEFLDNLPEGVLGGECDYRYLTQSQGPWLREREQPTERITAPATNRLRSIKSPLPAALAVFMLVLAGTAMWGMHVAETTAQEEPAALKALPVEEDDATAAEAQPVATPPPAPGTAPKSKKVDYPVFVRKDRNID
ncbi:MAG: helix-turn-helix domain-containing protein [Prosthecobacter sp.]